jgi:hypothetical protein
MAGSLGPYVGLDWQTRAGSLEWSCWQTAAHVAHDLLAYAGQLAARPPAGYLPFDLVVATHASPAEMLEVVSGCGRLLSASIAVAPRDARGWHWGMCDPEGFAAMGVAEALVHTYDIARGLGVRWLPPQDLAEVVVDRLVPDAPRGPATEVLLWATGRADLEGHPRVTSWVWRAAAF